MVWLLMQSYYGCCTCVLVESLCVGVEYVCVGVLGGGQGAEYGLVQLQSSETWVEQIRLHG